MTRNQPKINPSNKESTFKPQRSITHQVWPVALALAPATGAILTLSLLDTLLPCATLSLPVSTLPWTVILCGLVGDTAPVLLSADPRRLRLMLVRVPLPMEMATPPLATIFERLDTTSASGGLLTCASGLD
jgi:hypothetical protein